MLFEEGSINCTIPQLNKKIKIFETEFLNYAEKNNDKLITVLLDIIMDGFNYINEKEKINYPYTFKKEKLNYPSTLKKSEEYPKDTPMFDGLKYILIDSKIIIEYNKKVFLEIFGNEENMYKIIPLFFAFSMKENYFKNVIVNAAYENYERFGSI